MDRAKKRGSNAGHIIAAACIVNVDPELISNLRRNDIGRHLRLNCEVIAGE